MERHSNGLLTPLDWVVLRSVLDQNTQRRGALLAGIGAGIACACADWAASGLGRTPPVLVFATLCVGALAGGLAGALGAWLGRTTLGPGLVLAGALGLEAASIASKELVGSARGLGLGLSAALALAALVLATRRTSRTSSERRAASIGTTLGAIACHPASLWLAARLTESPWARLGAAAVPLAWLVLAQRVRPIALRGGAVLGVVAAFVAAQFEPGAPRRPSLPTPPPAATPRPSVVLLVIDTLRADAVRPDGALAEFARGGVEFRQCVTAAPWTLPAVSSLLTGLLPSQHGAVSAETALAEDVVTLAELLREQGYATGAFTGGAFVGQAHRLDQGFQVFDSGCERRFAPFGVHTPLLWRIAKNRYLPWRGLVRAVDEQVGLAGVLGAAQAWVASSAPGPRFLFLHTYQVHDYYLYDPDLDDEVRAALTPPSSSFRERLSVHPAEFARASQDDLEYFRGLYLGRVAAVERLFPEIVATLAPLVGADALWIVTADHGEGFDAAAGRVHHGGRLHEDLLRVPLFLRAPGRLASGRVVEDTVRSIDVLPTVLELVGVPPPEGLAGESLLPALRGERPFPSSAFAEERAPGFDLLALRRDGWKAIQTPNRVEIYHLTEDPLERLRIPGGPQEELRAALAGFPARYPARERAEIELDPVTLEHLRSLGYVR